MVEIHKMLVRIANREDPDQTASSEVCTVWLMARLFWTATSVQNLRTFTVTLFSTIFQLYHNDQL